MAKFVIQSHVRLQEWVAEEHGYFVEQGLDYEFEPSFTSRSQTTSSIRSADTSAQEARSGTYEDLEQGRTCDVSSACHWTAITAESATGKMWGRGYSVAPAGIFVQPDSPYKRPEHLAGIPIGVGYHSGSHYSALRGLEPFLARSAINVSFPGQLDDRVRLMLQGEIPAANVFGAQFYLLAQLGFHKLVDTPSSSASCSRSAPPSRMRNDTSVRWRRRNATSTSSRSATSSTGCTRCPTTWPRSPTCAVTDPVSA